MKVIKLFYDNITVSDNVVFHQKLELLYEATHKKIANTKQKEKKEKLCPHVKSDLSQKRVAS